jgi:hypothetical protein
MSGVTHIDVEAVAAIAIGLLLVLAPATMWERRAEGAPMPPPPARLWPRRLLGATVAAIGLGWLWSRLA